MKEYINIFATSYGLDKWDFIAVAIAFLALCCALYSIVIARRNLASQRNTERNTIPLMSEAFQRSEFDMFGYYIFISYLTLLSVKELTKVSNDNIVLYPSDEILLKIKLPIENIHCELFFNDWNNYFALEGFMQMWCKPFNIDIDVLVAQLKIQDLDISFKLNKIEHLISNVQSMSIIWLDLLHRINYKSTPSFLLTLPYDDINAEVKTKFYVNHNDVFVNMLENEQDQHLLITFMNYYIENHIRTYKRFLISTSKKQTK